MSSAEDRTSSTVLPSQASSNSAPEEFPVDPHQENSNERDASAPLQEGSSKVELSASDSPAQAPEEPPEDAATPLRTKPLPKVNAVAREVRVKVTGARLISGERDLFAESTTTVLVFEKGGVIRLTAAVTPGQLLFLTNEESKREVVTQVTRKRDHRPTECYVELEFTEPAPGFWGMEFSAATALLPRDAREVAAAELIASAETTDDELDEAAPRPSAEEVEALRREVDALRSQLMQLQTPAEPRQAESAGTVPGALAVSLAATGAQTETPSYQTEKVPLAELTADTFPIEGAPKPGQVAADNLELAKPALVFRKALPGRKRSLRARGQFTPGFRTGMLRLALLSSILAALIGTAWYKGWLPWIHQPKKISVSSWAGGVTTPVSTPRVSLPNDVPADTTKANSGNDLPVSVNGKSSGAERSNETSVQAVAGNEHSLGSSRPTVSIVKPVARGKNTPPATLAKSSPVHSLPTKTGNSVPTSVSNHVDVPPKLIRSQRAVASLDDLRDFETGSVVVDAIIDTAGNVTSMRVLAGPPSLRWPALQALKNYKYEPAMQNGQPVAAHVTVKIQFHFE